MDNIKCLAFAVGSWHVKMTDDRDEGHRILVFIDDSPSYQHGERLSGPWLFLVPSSIVTPPRCCCRRQANASWEPQFTTGPSRISSMSLKSRKVPRIGIETECCMGTSRAGAGHFHPICLHLLVDGRILYAGAHTQRLLD